MLIAAYTGCGKSAAAQKLNVLDLPSMPYRWLLPCKNLELCDKAELEREKGALHRVADPRFPENYILEILRAEGRGETVLFPTIVPVINALVERYGRTVHVVCPEADLKEEYRVQRYLARGNSESFLRIFVDGWEEQMEAIGESGGVHHRLKSGEYLEPLVAEWLKQGQAEPAPVPDSALAELEREVEERARELALWLLGSRESFACSIADLDRPETREFLDKVGKTAYDGGLYPPRLLPARKIREYERETWCGGVTWLEGEEQFMEAVEREAALLDMA